MQDGRFPVELVSGVPVVTVPEEIDITNAPDLRSALLQAAADGPGTLVADMTRTRFCDSSGLHTLLAAHKRARAEGGDLLLVIRSAAVLRIFAITAMDRMIPNFTSLDDALAHTSPGGSNPAPAEKRADRHARCLRYGRADPPLLLATRPPGHGAWGRDSRSAPPSTNAGARGWARTQPVRS